ncbi:hypothetical protein FS837_001700 [Tulasnella sp. UAMH 9824]|nr:hypothetical protein FS837_001700 [Tulasnella sp. UAMH 9824]
MGIPGPARTVLFSTVLLSQTDIDGSAEFVDVNGRIFLLKTQREYFEVKRLVDGTTLEDIIKHLKNRRLGKIFVKEENWASDFMALEQHSLWLLVGRFLSVGVLITVGTLDGDLRPEYNFVMAQGTEQSFDKEKSGFNACYKMRQKT